MKINSVMHVLPTLSSLNPWNYRGLQDKSGNSHVSLTKPIPRTQEFAEAYFGNYKAEIAEEISYYLGYDLSSEEFNRLKNKVILCIRCKWNHSPALLGDFRSDGVDDFEQNFSGGLREIAAEELGVAAIKDELLIIQKPGLERFAILHNYGESKYPCPAAYSPGSLDTYDLSHTSSSKDKTADPEHYYKTHLAEIVDELSFYADRNVTVEEIEKKKDAMIYYIRDALGINEIFRSESPSSNEIKNKLSANLFYGFFDMIKKRDSDFISMDDYIDAYQRQRKVSESGVCRMDSFSKLRL